MQEGPSGPAHQIRGLLTRLAGDVSQPYERLDSASGADSENEPAERELRQLGSQRERASPIHLIARLAKQEAFLRVRLAIAGASSGVAPLDREADQLVNRALETLARVCRRIVSQEGRRLDLGMRGSGERALVAEVAIGGRAGDARGLRCRLDGRRTAGRQKVACGVDERGTCPGLCPVRPVRSYETLMLDYGYYSLTMEKLSGGASAMAGENATRSGEAIVLHPEEGEALWFNNDLLTFKATGEDTGGAFLLVEELAHEGKAHPSPHASGRGGDVLPARGRGRIPPRRQRAVAESGRLRLGAARRSPRVPRHVQGRTPSSDHARQRRHGGLLPRGQHGFGARASGLSSRSTWSGSERLPRPRAR